jgi:hypothetical protein
VKIVPLKTAFLFLLLYCLCGFSVRAQMPVEDHAHNAIHYIENKGQWPSIVKYQSTISGGKVWLGDSSMLFQLQDMSELHRAHMDLEIQV